MIKKYELFPSNFIKMIQAIQQRFNFLGKDVKP